VIARLVAFCVAGLIGITTGIPTALADPPGALAFGGLQRTYLVHAPAGPATGLVLNLHGAGQSGAQQAGLTGYDAIADQFGFVVAYPDGIDQSWADGRGASIPDRQGVDDVGFLAALITRLSAEYAIPPGRVFVTGMSAGAFMANRLACARADLVSAVAPVAGTLGSGVGCAPSRPVSVLMIHGTADPVVPFNGGPMVGRGGPSTIISAPALAELWRQADGCGPFVEEAALGPVARADASGCAGGAQVTLARVNGGGHTWLDASAATGQFFASH